MKLVAFSDIHGAYELVVSTLRSLPLFDAVVIAGDLTTKGTYEEAAAAIRRIQEFGKPVFAVAGNMDPADVQLALERLNVSIEGKGRKVNDVGLFGVGGSPISPMRTPFERTEAEVMAAALSGWNEAAKAKRRIFVPHAPPKDTPLDKVFIGIHAGSTAVREFIRQHQPDVVLCGHIHEARGSLKIGTSTVVNCGPAGKGNFVEIDIADDVRVMLHP